MSTVTLATTNAALNAAHSSPLSQLEPVRLIDSLFIETSDLLARLSQANIVWRPATEFPGKED